MSKTYPPSRSSRPASAASARPFSVRSTSVQPVKRFSLFQVLSPWRSSTTLCTYRAPSGEARGGTELLFDAQQLVVLADPVGAACRSGFDLARRGADREIGNRRILGLAGAVRDDRRVAGVGCHPYRVEGLGDRPDLIQLDQQRVADVVGDAFLQDLRVGHEHIVADQLHARAEHAREELPALPIAFGEAVLDRDDRVLANPVLVEADHLFRGSIGLA